VKHEGAEALTRGEDGGDGLALFREQCRTLGTQRQLRRLDALGFHLDAGDPAARHQRARRLAPGAEVLSERRRSRFTLREQETEQRALPRCTPRLAGGGRGRARGGQEPALLPGARGGAQAQRPRQRAGEDLSNGVVVVVGRPVKQRHQGGIEHRRSIEHFQDRLEPCRGDLGVPGELGDDAHPALPAERNPHARSGSDWGARLERGEVVEQPAQGGVQRHPDNVGHSLLS
jgi:hypothetical protein